MLHESKANLTVHSITEVTWYFDSIDLYMYGMRDMEVQYVCTV